MPPKQKMLQRCGIRYLGFPLRLPVHRKDLSEDAAAAIIKNLAPSFFGVLITYLDRAIEIAALYDALGARIDFRRSVEDSGGQKSREKPASSCRNEALVDGVFQAALAYAAQKPYLFFSTNLSNQCDSVVRFD